MTKFYTVLFLALFSFSAFAQSSLVQFGTAGVSGSSTFESPMAAVVFLNQAPNAVNGVFADASCALCGTGQQTVAENFAVAAAGPSYGITELVIWGGYYPENIPNSVDDFTIILHADAGGQPGTVLETRSGLEATTRATTGVVLFGVDEYVFTFDLTASPILIPNTGTYWFEIFNNSVESGNFFWETGTLDATMGVAGSGWFTTTPGTSWNLDPATDFSFQINGDDNIPVELTSFRASASGSSVSLNWETASETNNRGFSIERSSGAEFETIGFVAGFGTTTQSRQYSYTDNDLSSGTYSYRLKQVDFDGTAEYSNIAEVKVAGVVEFKLDQNYPNPFNPVTSISWGTSSAGLQTLKVFDVLGKEVATLVNEYRPAGNYQVQWDASNVPSGMYVYQLTSGTNVVTKKMVLLK